MKVPCHTSRLMPVIMTLVGSMMAGPLSGQEEQPDSVTLDNIRRRTPSGLYANPTSFFS